MAAANGLVRRMKPGQTPVVPGLNSWWARYAQKPQVWANLGRGKFQDLSPEQSTFCGTASVGRSLAVADLNNGGAPDLILCSVGGPARVYRNMVPNRGHWIKFRVLDEHRRDALGAELTMTVGSRTIRRDVRAAYSYLASNDPRIHVGLGNETLARNVAVRWPDGSRQRFGDVNADRIVTLARTK